MRIGLVDLGTNSVRYDVYEFDENGSALLLHSEKEMIRLGQNLFTGGRLDSRAVNRLLRSFREYRAVTRELGVDRIAAFATSALREAKDREKIRRRLKEETGISVRIISGAEEARLIALGIVANERRRRGRYAIIDIGGGSTEIILCEGDRIRRGASFRAGVARLQEVYLKGSPPKGYWDAHRYLERLFRSPQAQALGRQGAAVALGSSGTVKALAKILKRTRGEDAIRRIPLRDLRERMTWMNRGQLLNIPGMTEKRVDLILGGAMILEACMDLMGVKRVLPTPFALRDGLLERIRIAAYDAGNDAGSRKSGRSRRGYPR